MNRPHSHRNLLWSGHWPVVFHKQTGTLLYSLFVSWSFYWQSNGRVDGFTMCTLSDAYCYQGITLLQYHNRVHSICILIINALQLLLSNAYNFTITIYILLYDTESVNQDTIVQYSIRLSILNI